MRRRSALSSLIVLPAALPPARAATAGPSAAPTPAAAINKAGSLRMLTQRAAKAYLMLGQRIAPARARVILDESIATFDARLAELAVAAATPDARTAHEQLARRWVEYRAVLVAPPSLDGAREIYVLGELAQEAAHRLTLALERASPTPADHLVNLAGRQRMLGQRAAKYALFIAWKVQPQAAAMELSLARSWFSPAMRQLEAGARDDATRAQLGRVDREWVAFGRALDRTLDRAPTPAKRVEVADRSERLLELSEALVWLFERQADAAARASAASAASALTR